MKYVGFFVIASIIFFIMQSKGILFDSLIGILFTGFGILLAYVGDLIFISCDNDLKLAHYIKNGKEIEEKYQSMINSSYFRVVESYRILNNKLTIFSRLWPFCFVGFFTGFVGVTLSMQYSNKLVIFVGVITSVLLVSSVIFLSRITKKNQIRTVLM